MNCSHCNGRLIRETDERNEYEYVCINCGRSPRIMSLGQWYARQEYPTDKVYKRGSKAPPTRVYE